MLLNIVHGGDDDKRVDDDGDDGDGDDDDLDDNDDDFGGFVACF